MERIVLTVPVSASGPAGADVAELLGVRRLGAADAAPDAEGRLLPARERARGHF